MNISHIEHVGIAVTSLEEASNLHVLADTLHGIYQNASGLLLRIHISVGAPDNGDFHL